jgi:hypothetical protein
MEEIQTQRTPLYGRIDLQLLVHPFRPHEAAPMLRRLPPAERALVYGLVGGVPLYLDWWDESASLRENLLRLVCTPGGQLLSEGELVLSSDLGISELGRRVVSRSPAAGRSSTRSSGWCGQTRPARSSCWHGSGWWRRSCR